MAFCLRASFLLACAAGSIAAGEDTAMCPKDSVGVCRPGSMPGTSAPSLLQRNIVMDKNMQQTEADPKTTCTPHKKDVCGQMKDGLCQCTWESDACLKSDACTGFGVTSVEDPPEAECWVLMPTGCDKTLGGFETPTKWFVNPKTIDSATCTASLDEYNAYCNRNDATTQWGSQPAEATFSGYTYFGNGYWSQSIYQDTTTLSGCAAICTADSECMAFNLANAAYGEYCFTAIENQGGLENWVATTSGSPAYTKDAAQATATTTKIPQAPTASPTAAPTADSTEETPAVCASAGLMLAQREGNVGKPWKDTKCDKKCGSKRKNKKCHKKCHKACTNACECNA